MKQHQSQLFALKGGRHLIDKDKRRWKKGKGICIHANPKMYICKYNKMHGLTPEVYWKERIKQEKKEKMGHNTT